MINEPLWYTLFCGASHSELSVVTLLSMKLVIGIVVVLLLGVGAWYVLAGPGAEKNETVQDEMMNGDAAMHDDMTVEDNDPSNDDIDMIDPAMGDDDDMGMSVDPNAKEFNVSGVNYAFSQKEIRVKKGDTVVINFTSTEGFHDWVVDEFDAATERVNTGGSSSVTFVAGEVGTFEYYCSVGSHRQLGMVGNLVVEE